MAWVDRVTSANLLSLLIVLIIAVSVVQGARRGASGSARQLFAMIAEGAITLISIFLSWKLTEWLSPLVQEWLTSRNITVPGKTISGIEQVYYTMVTALRDFTLMRTALLFLIGYAVVKQILSWLVFHLAGRRVNFAKKDDQSQRGGFPSSIVGGLLGSLSGAGRSLIMIAVLFMYTVLFPQSSFTDYVRGSAIYQKGANEIIRPVTGDWIDKQLPVFTRAVESEFNNILKRKYEVLDANIPDDITEAAKEVTATAKTDEDKAKAIYEWIGTRVQYDWEKVRLYEDKRIWKEQTPEETFRTRQGVCIDYSRLYAVMAKSAGLEVKVVTGLGFDGKSSYGPHAWNEVYLGEAKGWVPLDSTWVASGGNWFNPPGFYNTHIKEV